MPSFSSRSALAPLLLLGTVGSAACGGIVVFDEGEGGGGEGGQGGATTSSVSVVTSVTTTTSVVSSSATVEPVGGGGPNLVEEVLGDGVEEAGFEVAVDAQTLGITAMAVGQANFSQLEFRALTAPSTAVVIDGALPSNGASWFWYGALAIAAPQISHPESFPLAEGTWRFDFASSSPSRVSVWRRRTVDGAFHGGVLDVNVFIADGSVEESYALDVIQDAYSDFGGVELGDVRFFQLPAGYGYVDENNMFDLVRETSVMPTRPALNIMAVSGIGGQLDGAAGFAYGVPGTPMLAGQEQSAVVWLVLYDSFYDPIILRHEAGHFAGLFHTSEFQAGLVDPLDDTPSCDDVLDQFEDCADWDYIMFPSGGSGAALFSPLQAEVIRGGALYRGSFSPGEPPMPPYGPELDLRASSGRIGLASLTELSTPAERAAALGARPTRRAAPNRFASAGLSASATRHLEGIGCPHVASARGGHDFADYFEVLEELGGLAPASLTELAFDASAPPHVRRRALGGLARLAERGEQAVDAASLERLATRDDEVPLVRMGALEALARVERPRALAIARRLEAGAHRGLASFAARLR
jgi:hypothetical protein